MNRSWREVRLASSLWALATLSGCTAHGAPSLILFGAYFPGWIFCAVLGILAAILARLAMVTSGLSAVLPLQLFVCAALGLLVAIAAWLLWFGR